VFASFRVVVSKANVEGSNVRSHSAVPTVSDICWFMSRRAAGKPISSSYWLCNTKMSHLWWRTMYNCMMHLKVKAWIDLIC